jgi:FkbM family methyltransferase
MLRPLRRVQIDVRTGRTLTRAGVTPGSAFLYPIRRRLPNGRNRLDLVGGQSIEAPLTEPLLETFREIWIDRRYAAHGCDVRQGEAIVDIGAHVGIFSVWAADQHPDAPILAVEPSPPLVAFLRRNVERSGLRNVSIAEVACGRERGRAVLHRGACELTNSLYRTQREADPDRSEEVDLVTLHDLFESHGIARCGFLKLDCEGAEYDILLGASAQTLGRVRQIAMEYHVGITPYGPDDLVRHLETHGFQTTVEPSPTDPVHGYLFARRPAESTRDAA